MDNRNFKHVLFCGFIFFLLSFFDTAGAKSVLSPGSKIKLGSAEVEIIKSFQTTDLTPSIGSMAGSIPKLKTENQYVVLEFRIINIKKETKLVSADLRVKTDDGNEFGPPGFLRVDPSIGTSVGHSGAACFLYSVGDELLIFFEIDKKYEMDQMRLVLKGL